MRQKLPICRCGAVRRLSFPSSSVLEVSQLCNKCELFSEPQDPFLQLVPKSRSAQLPTPRYPSGPHGLSPVHPLHGQASFLACTPLCTHLGAQMRPGGLQGVLMLRAVLWLVQNPRSPTCVTLSK